MKQYRIADAHAHIFPQKIAGKAVDSIGSFYGLQMTGTGLTTDLLAQGSAAGVERFLVCSTATTPAQVESINTFVAEECAADSRLLGFATLHPGYADLSGELQRVKALGLRGIKLHPDFQRFNIDDPAALAMYRLIDQAGLAVLFHTGDDRYDFSAPQRLGKVAAQFPGMVCIAAHFGGYNRWQDSVQYLGQPNVFYDTSSSLFRLSADEGAGIIQRLGDKRFFFGTDYPMWDCKGELARFMTMPLSESQREDILWNNFAALFTLS
ncbi:MAG: amidohydrolase family protein [Angelakisella sp.]